MLLIALLVQISTLNLSEPQDQTLLDGRLDRPLVGSFSSSDELGGWTVNIFEVPTNSAQREYRQSNRFFVARQSRGGDEGHLRDVRWADSRECEQMTTVLTGMGNLPSSRFFPGGIFGPSSPSYPFPKPVPADGKSSRVEGRAIQQDGAMAQMTITDVNGAATAWVASAKAALQGCWREDRPAMP